MVYTKRCASDHTRSHCRHSHAAVGIGHIVEDYLRSPQQRIISFWQRVRATAETLSLYVHSFMNLWVWFCFKGSKETY